MNILIRGECCIFAKESQFDRAHDKQHSSAKAERGRKIKVSPERKSENSLSLFGFEILNFLFPIQSRER